MGLLSLYIEGKGLENRGFNGLVGRKRQKVTSIRKTLDISGSDVRHQ